MNIFVLDENPIAAAQMLCDKHCVKMVLETAQLLCSCHSFAPYKRTHYNHPCAVWTRSSVQNYRWLIKYGLALCDEYTFRYGKVHASRQVIEWCQDNECVLPDIGLTPFVIAMPDECRVIDNPVESYKKYYLMYKKYMLKYTKRGVPGWIKNELRNEESIC